MYDEKELKKGYILLAVIGAAMVLSVVVYVVVAELIAKQNEPFSGFVGGFDKLDTLRYFLLAVAVSVLGITGIIRKALLSDTFSNILARPNALSPTGAQPAYGQFMSAQIVVFALCESVAIFGLVLFLIAGSRFDLYLFIVVSLAGYAVYFPRYSQLKDWALRREGGAEAGEGEHERHAYDRRTGKYRR